MFSYNYIITWNGNDSHRYEMITVEASSER